MRRFVADGGGGNGGGGGGKEELSTRVISLFSKETGAVCAYA
jgi:hypothetical protein